MFRTIFIILLLLFFVGRRGVLAIAVYGAILAIAIFVIYFVILFVGVVMASIF